MSSVLLFTEILIILNVIHWACDYTWLSTKWMLDAKRLGTPLLPIAVHASVHAVFMAIVIKMMHPESSLCVAYFQFFTHFAIDVWKGKMNVWFPSLQNPANKWHWVIFGFDQLLHQFVIIVISYYVILNAI